MQQVKFNLSCYGLFSLVPSKVKNIHISNSGDSSSLKVSWTPGQGDVDGYSVFLYRESRQLDVRSVLKHQNEVMFGSLQPGQLYRVIVQSVSGELVNNNTASGRTGQKLYSTLYCNIYNITIFINRSEYITFIYITIQHIQKLKLWYFLDSLHVKWNLFIYLIISK